MADSKRKSRDNSTRNSIAKKPKSTNKPGPRLPSRFRKALDSLAPKTPAGESSPGDADSDSDDGGMLVKNDLYEYEEGLAEEESRKNRRYDSVENLEYETPDEFEDEDITSDEEGMSGDEAEEESRHVRMLQGVTGMPGEAFTGKKKNKNAVITEAYPESEYNPSRDVMDGTGQVTFESLLAPLKGISSFVKLKKKINQVEKKVVPTQAPLHTAERERLERRAAYEQTKKDLFNWEPLIKRNREAPTMIFDNDVDIGFSTVGAIASEFEPRTEFEKKMAALVHDDQVMDAHREDGSRLLELNPVTLEDERGRQNRIAKMRSLLFRHEIKAKHIKKIKSKTYHRLLKKDRRKAESSENQIDPEAAKDLAVKHEFERAKERMTLRHRTSKWSNRIKERGTNAQDEGTRAAIAEKDRLHNSLTRKIRSMRDTSSSSEESGDDNESDYNSSGSEQGRASRLILEAKEKTLKVLNEEDEVPNSGLLSLPFMVRGMKKRNEAAAEEAKLAIEDLESLSKQFKGSKGAESPKAGTSSGRMVFNAAGKKSLKSSKTEASKKAKSDKFYDDSDSENEFEAEDNDRNENNGSIDLQNDVNVDSNLLDEVSEVNQDGLLKSFDDIAKDPGPKTTHEVAIFASGAWKKVKGETNNASNKKPPVAKKPVSKNQGLQETQKDLADDIDSDSEVEMVDGILSSGPKASYELPSQAELIHEAFAADNVEEDFEKQKQEALNVENPEPEKPVLLPGWGQWTHIQQKRGLPSWMVKEHETAKKKREEAIKKRKDAQLKNVIISEKLDKRAEKLYTQTLPFPYTSKEVFEQSIRMPIGPEYNPATTVAALNRPEVLKKPGQIIKPIKFEEVNPHEKGQMQKHGGPVHKPKKAQKQKRKQKKNKSQS